MTTNFDPMNAVVSDGGVVPAGQYEAKFVRAEYLPEKDPDPMTGKGGRKYAATRWVWQVVGGPSDGKEVHTDTGITTGPKSGYYQAASWVLGKAPPVGQPVGLSGQVGKHYLITVGNKPGKQWLEVTSAIPLPGK